MTDEAVDDEVDAGVENVERVGEVGETSDPEAGQEGVADPSISSEKIAADNVVQVGELPDVDYNSGRLATQEHEDDAEEDQGEIPFLPLNLWPVPLYLAALFVDVHDDLGLNDHGNDGDDGGHHDPGAYDVVLDVVAVDPKFCFPVSEDLLWSGGRIMFNPDKLRLEELWNVEEEGENDDGKDIIPTLSGVRRTGERITNTYTIFLWNLMEP